MLSKVQALAAVALLFCAACNIPPLERFFGGDNFAQDMMLLNQRHA